MGWRGPVLRQHGCDKVGGGGDGSIRTLYHTASSRTPPRYHDAIDGNGS